MQPKNKNKIVKFIFRAFLFVAALEIALRLAAGLYYFVHTKTSAQASAGKVTILCLGESTTFGLLVGFGEDYPSQLQELLEAKYPGRFRVVNKGVPGLTSSHLLLNVRRFIAETLPDLAIVLCGANEYNLRLMPMSSFLVLKNKNKRFQEFFYAASRPLSKLKTYRLLTLFVDYLRFGVVNYYGAYISNDENYPVIGDIQEKNLRDLLTRQYRSNMVEITRVVRASGADVMTTTYLCPQMHQEIRALSAEHNVVLCDQVAKLAKSRWSYPDLIGVDGFHPNVEGNKVMAGFLLETLEESGFLNSWLKQHRKGAHD